MSGILVAIPTLNEAATIRAVLDSLRRELPQERAVRFLVLDGGSTDGTREAVEAAVQDDARIAFVHNPKRFQSAALNLAAMLARPDETVLVRCDAHQGYPPGFVRRVATSLEHNQADSLVVPMDSVGSDCTGRAIAWVSDSPAGSGGSAHRGGARSGWVDHGHHAGWQLDSFREIGGYDETFSHNEDAELDARLNRSGGRVWLDAGIRLTYHVRPTLRALARQYANYGKGRSRTVRRHPGSLRARQLAVPAFVGANLLALLLAPVLPITLALPLFYLLALAAVTAQVTLRHRSACGLLAGPAALVMHVAWAWGFALGWLTIRQPRWHPPGEAREAP